MSNPEEIETRVPEDYKTSLKGDTVASEHRADVVLELLEEKKVDKDARIVDIGCGYGLLLRKLKKKKYNNILGIEPIHEVVEDLTESGIPARVGDLEQGLDSVDDRSADVVVCLEVLEHLYDPKAALHEINRCLRTDGLLIASVPNEYRLTQRLKMIRGRPVSDVSLVGGHIKFFDWNTFSNMVKTSGFRIDTQFSEGGIRMRKMIPGYVRIMRSLPRLLGKWIFIVAKKK